MHHLERCTLSDDYPFNRKFMKGTLLAKHFSYDLMHSQTLAAHTPHTFPSLRTLDRCQCFDWEAKFANFNHLLNADDKYANNPVCKSTHCSRWKVGIDEQFSISPSKYGCSSGLDDLEE